MATFAPAEGAEVGEPGLSRTGPTVRGFEWSDGTTNTHSPDSRSSKSSMNPRRGVVNIVTLLVLAIGLLATGCGSDSALPGRDAVQQSTWGWVKNQVPSTTSVDDPGCVADGDGGHWKCVTTLRVKGGTTQQITVSVTCDEESCLYEQT